MEPGARRLFGPDSKQAGQRAIRDEGERANSGDRSRAKDARRSGREYRATLWIGLDGDE